MFLFCCCFSLRIRSLHWQQLQSGLNAASLPSVLPLGSPLPAVSMPDTLPNQTKRVNYSFARVGNELLPAAAAADRCPDGEWCHPGSQQACCDAAGFKNPPPLHLPPTCILFEFIPLFRSGSDATWKDMTHTLTLPSVILPSFSGLLHTPDGGHPAPSLNRHSSPVLSAPQAGHWGGSAHPAGAHSHCAGKATTIITPHPPTPPPFFTRLWEKRLAHAHPPTSLLTASCLSSSSSSLLSLVCIFHCPLFATKSLVFISGIVAPILTH